MYTIIYGMFIPSVLIPYFHPIQFEDTGHQIIEMLNADRTLRIEMAAWRQPVIFAAENWWLDDEISFWDGLFSGAKLLLVLGRVENLWTLFDDGVFPAAEHRDEKIMEHIPRVRGEPLHHLNFCKIFPNSW